MLVESSTVSTMFGGAEGVNAIGSSASLVACANAGVASGPSASCASRNAATTRRQRERGRLFMMNLTGQRSMACQYATELFGPSTRTVMR